MNQILQDLRFAVRQLLRSPGFAITAVLTLALGVGANSAVFSLLDQALLRSLPVRDPQQLVILEGTGKAWEGNFSSRGGDPEAYFSFPMYRDLAERSSAFSGLLATSTADVGVQRRDGSSAEKGELVSGNYFQVLGVQPALGRLFVPGDDTEGGNHQVAVLSFGYWKNKLGSDPGVIGQTLQLNGNPVQVIGVAAPNFQSAVWGQTPSIFLPMTMLPQIDVRHGKDFNSHTFKFLNIVGRLREGVTAQAAQAQLAPLWHALRAEELKHLGSRSPRFVDDFLTRSQLKVLPGATGLSYRREGLQAPLLVVMGMAALVLLIAALNVASLILVRSSGRVREFAVRYALGATARRVVSQLLLEGLLLGLLGATAGTLLAPVAMRTIAKEMAGADESAFFTAAVDSRLLLIGFVTAVLVSVIFSVAPALQLLKPDMMAALKQQAGTAGGGRLGFRRIVVGLQVGLSLLLLVGAGLFAQTLRNLRHAEVGFDTSHLLTFTIVPQFSGISREMTPALFDHTLQRLATIPGVIAVGGTDSAELADSDANTNVSLQGYTPPPDDDRSAGVASISPGYFSTIGARMVAGREFSATDDVQHPLVAVVNESFAKQYYGSANAAVGRMMARGGGQHVDWRQIVGVVRNMRHLGPRQAAKPSFFMPLKQSPRTTRLTLYLRSTGAASSTAFAARSAMHDVDPSLAMIDLWDMEQQIDSDLSNERMIGLLAVSFSVLATLLAGIGLYGVLAFSVSQRTREIGIRMALGSTRERIARLVVSDVLRLAGIGMALALPVALLAARSVRSQLYGVSPADARSVCAAVLLIGAVALLAAVVPARRAATVHPNEALRTE